jgi:arylsulfatase A-like enzyme
MFINYLEPHLEYRPPAPYNDQFLPPGVTAQDASRVNQDAWSYIAGVAQMDKDDFKALRALYDGELAYLDFRIGEIIRFLRRRNLLDNTLLIITSDHGENIGEHSLMDHQYCLYDTLLRIPLIIRFPPVFSEGTSVEWQVQLEDIFPTILDLLNIHDETTCSTIQGQSLLPERLEQRKRDYAISEYIGPQPTTAALKRRVPEADDRKIQRFDRSLAAVRADKYKLIVASDGRDELYNIKTDLGEESNLIEKEPAVAEELRQMLNEWKDTFEVTDTGEAPEVDGAVRERLEALGYLQ